MDDLLQEMVGQGASDLHLSCGTVPILRVDGSVREMKEKESIGLQAALQRQGIALDL